VRERIQSWGQTGWRREALIEFTAPRDWRTTGEVSLHTHGSPAHKVILVAGTRLRYEERIVQEFYDEYGTIVRRFLVLDGPFRGTRVVHRDDYWWGDYRSGSLAITYVAPSFPPQGLQPEVGEWRPWGPEHT